MKNVPISTGRMRVGVFRECGAARQLLGTCELPNLDADVIEVLHSRGEADILRGALRPPEAHRFAILRGAEAGDGRMALLPQEDARPEVLPAWQPA